MTPSDDSHHVRYSVTQNESCRVLTSANKMSTDVDNWAVRSLVQNDNQQQWTAVDHPVGSSPHKRKFEIYFSTSSQGYFLPCFEKIWHNNWIMALFLRVDKTKYLGVHLSERYCCQQQRNGYPNITARKGFQVFVNNRKWFEFASERRGSRVWRMWRLCLFCDNVTDVGSQSFCQKGLRPEPDTP